MIPRSLRALLLSSWILAMAGLIAGVPVRAQQPTVHGLPFIRSYSLGDIGNVPRGSHLGFDRHGRVAAIHEAVYTVLNDNVWLNLAEGGGRGRIPMVEVRQATDGRSYYGARGSWGVVEVGNDGLLHPVPLAPATCPPWISTAVFGHLLVSEAGVYFISWNGVVFWDFKRRENVFFEVPRLSCAFMLGRQVYVSAFSAPLRIINPETRTLESAGGTELDGDVVEHATTLDATHALVSFMDGHVASFDGHHLATWPRTAKNPIKGHVTVLQQLVDGRIAVAVTGQGLLLFSPAGELLLALTTPRYSNISAVANREPGVLWAATEESIDKILYGSSLSMFGEALGLPVGWPIIARWHGRIYVASGGKLYASVAGEPGEPTRFELCAQQPPRGTFALAAWGPHMLVGNGSGVYEAESDGTYRPVPTVNDLAHLVMVDADHCYAIGRSETALMEWRNERWTETGPRVAGIRNPAIVHRVGKSVWIEMGGDGVARLWNRNGQLHLDVVPNHTWTKTAWVNVGAVGDIVVLSSLQEEPRRFFDERTGDWCAAPDLERLLNRSPYWIARVQQDNEGVIWATHNEGLVRFAPNGKGYDMDATSFDLVNDRYPIVRILPDGDVWMYAERSLYHIERAWTTPAQSPAKPALVSLVDVQHNTELLTTSTVPPTPLRLAYSSNSLNFRFNADGQGWRRVPGYEYHLNEQEPWTAFDGSLLSLRNLREGQYHLQVRIMPYHDSTDHLATIDFEILPPWSRSWPAYVLWGCCAAAVLWGAICWSTLLARQRNRKLERIVHERTHQLELTMARLNDETRTTATLAERNRLANEIHDSVQQGLTGAMLQLDTTLKLRAVAGDIRARLNVVRNMISYARQEVQHAVWDMESPLLEGTGLADALHNLTAHVASDADIEVVVTGDPMPLPREINHNLFRIAQEATTNAFRHANAKKISIRLEYGSEADTVALEVVDDGIGFCTDDVLLKSTGHLGLRGIRVRAKKIGGTLNITSAPHAGTSIRIEVPLSGQAKETPHANVSWK